MEEVWFTIHYSLGSPCCIKNVQTKVCITPVLSQSFVYSSAD